MSEHLCKCSRCGAIIEQGLKMREHETYCRARAELTQIDQDRRVELIKQPVTSYDETVELAQLQDKLEAKMAEQDNRMFPDPIMEAMCLAAHARGESRPLSEFIDELKSYKEDRIIRIGDVHQLARLVAKAVWMPKMQGDIVHFGGKNLHDMSDEDCHLIETCYARYGK